MLQNERKWPSKSSSFILLSCKFASTAKVTIWQPEDNTALNQLKLLSSHNFRYVVSSLSVWLLPSPVFLNSTAFSVNPSTTLHITRLLGACTSVSSYAFIIDWSWYLDYLLSYLPNRNFHNQKILSRLVKVPEGENVLLAASRKFMFAAFFIRVEFVLFWLIRKNLCSRIKEKKAFFWILNLKLLKNYSPCYWNHFVTNKWFCRKNTVLFISGFLKVCVNKEV